MSNNDEVSKIQKLLKDNGIPVDEISRIEKVRLGTYQAISKDSEGNVTTHDLEANSLILTPAWSDGPKWPVIAQAKPTVITPTSVVPVKKSKLQTAVILPDPQIGYRLDARTGTFDPFHDERAMDIALQVVSKIQPDVIVNIGDLLDFPMFGKYQQEPAFALTAQAALDRAHAFLAQQRAIVPSAEIALMEGNHDRRLQNSTIINAAASFGLTQANTPKGWPVLSVPHLLRLDELGVKYVDAYPAGRYWLNDKLVCQHGNIVKSAGMTAKSVLENETVSTIHGHVHRLEMAYNTKNTRYGYITRFAISAGCLCRIDGAVPGVHSSTDVFGKPVVYYDNWQQGLAVATYEKGAGDFSIEHLHIQEGKALFRGEEFNSRKSEELSGKHSPRSI